MKDKINEIARYICNNCEQTLPLSYLSRMAGISQFHFQKTFKTQIGLSPKELQKCARKKTFKAHLKQSGNILDAIYAAGFGSTSRLYENIEGIGIHPKTYKNGAKGETIFYSIKQALNFKILMAASKIGVCAVEIGNDSDILIANLQNEFENAQLMPSADSEELDKWATALSDYLDHQASRPDLPLDLRGTILQEKIWRFLTTMGEKTMTYGQIASEIGIPKGARAIANAVAKNRIAILIPCHKVLRANGEIGGYKWGAPIKEILLQKGL